MACGEGERLHGAVATDARPEPRLLRAGAVRGEREERRRSGGARGGGWAEQVQSPDGAAGEEDRRRERRRCVRARLLWERGEQGALEEVEGGGGEAGAVGPLVVLVVVLDMKRRGVRRQAKVLLTFGFFENAVVGLDVCGYIHDRCSPNTATELSIYNAVIGLCCRLDRGWKAM